MEPSLERDDLEPRAGDRGGAVPRRLAAAQGPGPEERVGGAPEPRKTAWGERTCS